MMKILIILLFAVQSGICQQPVKFTSDNSLFLGTGVNSDLTSDLFLQFDCQSEWVQLQLSYLTDFKLIQSRFNAKLGFRVLNWRREDLGLWIYQPYLNMNLNEGGKYNSPFSFEVRWKGQLSLILDVSRTSQFQVRYRTKLFSIKTDN